MAFEDVRCTMVVDLDAIAWNAKELRRRAGGLRMLAVQKADAYGLGADGVAPMLRENGASLFGAATLPEALSLLPHGLPVMMLGGPLPEEIPEAVAAGVILPAAGYELAKLIDDEAAKQRKTAVVELKIDSGMGRLGMVAEEAEAEIAKIAALEHLEIRGIYSHFSSATEYHHPYCLRQRERFLALLDRLLAKGMRFQDIHMCATGGIVCMPECCAPPFTLIRGGIGMYGYCDLPGMERPLRPAVTMKTRLAGVRRLGAGSFLGYNRTFRLTRESLVGTVSMGYASGLPVTVAPGTSMLVHGVRCPVVGRVSMDYCTILLDEVPEARVGDDVICVGKQGDEEVTLAEWSAGRGTHEYETLCAFGMRAARKYVHGCV